MKGIVGHLPACYCKNCPFGLGSYNSSSAVLVIKLVGLCTVRGVGNLSVEQDFLRKFAKKCLSCL